MKPKLSLMPQDTKNSNCWYYENINGIEVIYKIYDMDGNYMRTDHIIIPYGKLNKSIQRITAIRNLKK